MSLAVQLFVFSLVGSALALVTPIPRAAAYMAPTTNGGSQLDSSAGLGEPLNASAIFCIQLNQEFELFQPIGDCVRSLFLLSSLDGRNRELGEVRCLRSSCLLCSESTSLVR